MPNPFANQPGFPKDFQITDVNGLMTPAWQYFFMNVWQRLQTIYAPFFFAGSPTASQQLVFVNTVPAQIPPNFSTQPPQYAPNIPGLFVLVDILPVAPVTFTLFQVIADTSVEQQIGTITLNPDGSFSGTTTSPTGASLAVGDLLLLNAPASPDPSMTNIEIIIPMLWS